LTPSRRTAFFTTPKQRKSPAGVDKKLNDKTKPNARAASRLVGAIKRNARRVRQKGK